MDSILFESRLGLINVKNLKDKKKINVKGGEARIIEGI